MTNITIPSEALEAAARAACEDRGYNWDKNINFHPAFRRIALATIRAALAAWPGMQHRIHIEHAIILPLPQEKTDVEA